MLFMQLLQKFSLLHDLHMLNTLEELSFYRVFLSARCYCISRSESINILVLPHFIAGAVYAVKQTFSQDKRLKNSNFGPCTARDTIDFDIIFYLLKFNLKKMDFQLNYL